MLQSIRDKAQGLVAWVIVILIVIPFALWGIQEYIGGGTTTSVAQVAGEDITEYEFENFYRVYRERETQRLRTRFGNAMNSPLIRSLLDEQRMRKNALDVLIRNKVLLLSSLKAGYRIGDERLAAQVQAIPSFQRDGRFDSEAYALQLRNQGLTPVGFEQRLRADLLIEQVINGVLKTDAVTRPELDAVIRLQQQKREVGYMVVPYARYEQEISIDEPAMREYYDRNKARFMSPERVRIQYVELSAKQLAAEIEVTDADLMQYYQTHVDEYTEVDTRAALAKAQEVLARLQAGESFEALAGEYSEDPGSKAQGGDLGFFGKNAMVKVFEDAVYAMDKGAVSAPVKSQFGYHIIKLTDIRGDERRASHILIGIDAQVKRTLDLDEVRERVGQEFRRQTAEDRFIDASETLANLAYEVPDTLDDAANAVGLAIQASDWLTRGGGAGILSRPEVMESAFSETLITERTNSDPIELAPDHIVVLRVQDYDPASQRPYAELTGDIEVAVRSEKARERAREIAEKALERLQALEDPVAVADTLQLEWIAPVPVGRRDEGVPPSVLQRAFALPRSAGPAAAYQTAALPSGDVAVFGVFSVQDGDPQTVEAAEREALASALRQAQGEQALQGMLASARKASNVVVLAGER